jgi:hypothetical protein
LYRIFSGLQATLFLIIIFKASPDLAGVSCWERMAEDSLSEDERDSSRHCDSDPGWCSSFCCQGIRTKIAWTGLHPKRVTYETFLTVLTGSF